MTLPKLIQKGLAPHRTSGFAVNPLVDNMLRCISVLLKNPIAIDSRRQSAGSAWRVMASRPALSSGAEAAEGGMAFMTKVHSRTYKM